MSITDPQGRPINAVYGMIAAIIRLSRELEPAGIIAAFDEPDEQTFRQQLYPLYQAQRGPLGGIHAEDFRRQVSVAREALPRIGVPVLSRAGYEADDIMGTLACRVAEGGESAVLVSTDRDLLQLVGPRIAVLPPATKGTMIQDDAGVRERLGVGPRGVPHFKALAGDPSDNIPGVRGIGSKTAAELVNRYGELETIYQHVAELPRRAARALEEDRDAAYLFLRLATIHTDLELPISIDALPLPEIDGTTRAGTVLRRLGYRDG